jgi:pyruvate,water dikinase
MTAEERRMAKKQVFPEMSTGLPELDAVFTGVFPGDNIVFQVDSLDDYIPFVRPFAECALLEKRELIYFRFADHPEVMPPGIKAHVYRLDPNEGFENFISAIFDVIEKYGKGACYVFDCLSDLAADWYSDRMLGNFFLLTCPYLFDYETATYFALLRNHHMAVATGAIHATAQVVVDVFRQNQTLYLHPLKVYKRHSETMYMLHRWEDRRFTPVQRSADIAEILSSVPQVWLDFTLQEADVWTKSFLKAHELLQKKAKADAPVADGEEKQLLHQLLSMAFTREPRLLELAERHFTLADLIAVAKRLIGTGRIGGKSVGMLLARAILLSSDPSWKNRLEAHDSFFIGSDVFYTYLIQNRAWWHRRKLIKREIPLASAEEVRTRMLQGVFPEEIVSQFREMLEYFGQAPIIVRSSSLLEDAYGNSFSGKYESVFCANQGTPRDRLESFMAAVRTVYASTLTYEALAYRAHRGLLESDEQMALLVQRVSGVRYGKLFFPELAGVGFSYNPYAWSSEIDPAAGLIRLVFGLGTRAVDRHDDDYTRVISLSAPLRRPVAELADAFKYSQRRLDLLDLEANALAARDFQEIAGMAPDPLLDLVATLDRDMETRARELKLKDVFPYVLTFDKLLTDTDFVENMKRLLATLQAAYRYPVDIEFTANFTSPGEYRINLLQCRPFQTKGDLVSLPLPKNIPVAKTIIKTSGPIIGTSLAERIERIVYVVPERFANLPAGRAYELARLIGRITHLKGAAIEGGEHTIVLIGPGRWGTTTPALGVPVNFSEINTVKVICEVAKMHAGLVPDVSLGTHFFNDLVEADILYLGVYPDRDGYVYNQDFLDRAPNRLAGLIPEAASWSEVLRVIDPDEAGLNISADAVAQEAVIYIG